MLENEAAVFFTNPYCSHVVAWLRLQRNIIIIKIILCSIDSGDVDAQPTPL